MVELGWITDWLVSSGVRDFMLDFFQLGTLRTTVLMMIGAILGSYARRVWFRLVHPNLLQQSWDDLRQARRWLALERAMLAAQRRRLRTENAALRAQSKALREQLDRLTAGMALA
jgi:hypothetical protein